MIQGSHAIDIRRREGGATSGLEDQVAVEEPLEIRLGYATPEGRAHRAISITMRTPGNDRELAAGFLFTESIISHADDVLSIDHCGPPAPSTGYRNVVRVELAAHVDVDLGRLERHFYTTSSCGVCGKTSLDALHANGLHAFGEDPGRFRESVLLSIPAKLRDGQETFAQTGGLHAAGAFDASGKLAVVMEDVGRHNAVDKLVGHLLLNRELPADDLGLMVSGRASFELLQKALVARFPLLAAVSAPSSLAVSLAREFNMTLVGFLRDDTYNVYAGTGRLGL
ncbi:MAG: formate dehydrogenase accessory sulfurtransferase FdhD [Woeseiaceae bacterium]|nr:formate dehydrogenase accessory sulfurtransferase FdhD [Woeseiaceae bacterium]